VLANLPPRSRAVLSCETSWGWSASETADLLEAALAAVNSALQRAAERVFEELGQRGRSSGRPSAPPTDEERVMGAAALYGAHARATCGVIELLGEGRPIQHAAGHVRFEGVPGRRILRES